MGDTITQITAGGVNIAGRRHYPNYRWWSEYSNLLFEKIHIHKLKNSTHKKRIRLLSIKIPDICSNVFLSDFTISSSRSNSSLFEPSSSPVEIRSKLVNQNLTRASWVKPPLSWQTLASTTGMNTQYRGVYKTSTSDLWSLQYSTRAKDISKNSLCCPCGKKYLSKTSYSLHMRLECGKEPQFSCMFCPKRSYQKIALQKHILSKHPEQKGVVKHIMSTV
uniref:Longitudinals lacking protein, isoforms A/B/D/L n=1 Tax=Cacopsylla melanoneura TaxID=428564 RepID=A0A8D8Z3F5_9HEMI